MRFLREYQALLPAQRYAFLKAMRQMVEDLRAKRPLRASLRIKRVQGHARIFEMSRAADGRATFEYGDEQIPGEPHIIWRRIGGHGILTQP